MILSLLFLKVVHFKETNRAVFIFTNMIFYQKMQLEPFDLWMVNSQVNLTCKVSDYSLLWLWTHL